MQEQPGSSNNLKVEESAQNIHSQGNNRPSAPPPEQNISTVPKLNQDIAPPPPPPSQSSGRTRIVSRLSRGMSITDNPIQKTAANMRVEKLFNQMMRNSNNSQEAIQAANKRVEKLFFQMVKKDLKKRCDHCRKGTDETSEKVVGKKAWLCCLLVILIPFLLFYCHPICDDNFKDTQFICKECGQEKRTMKARLF